MENENNNVNGFDQPQPVVVPESEVAPAEPAVEPAPVEPVVETPAPVAEEPKVSDIPPVEITSPSMANPEPVKEEVAPVEPPKEKGKGGAILAVVLVLVLLIGGGYFYLRMTHTGEKFLESVIDNVNKEVKAVFAEYKAVDLNKSDFKMDGTVKVTANGDALSYVNNVNLAYDMGLSLKNDYLTLGLKLSQDDVASDVKAVINEDTAYADLGDLFAKKFFVKGEENFFADVKEEMADVAGDANSFEDLEYELTKELEYAKEALKLSKITTKYEGLNVVYTYVIDETNMDKINAKYKELVEKDTKLMELSGVTELVSETVTAEVKVGLFSNKLEGLSVKAQSDTLSVTKQDANKYLVEANMDGEKTVVNVTVKGTEYTMVMKQGEEDLGTLIVDQKGNKLHLVYNYKNEEMDIALTLDYNKLSDSKYSVSVSGALVMGSDKVNLDVTANVESKEGLVPKTIPEGYVNMETFTPEALNPLQTNVMERLSKYKFYTLIEAFASQEESSDYSYNVIQ